MCRALVELWFLRLLVAGFEAQFLAECYGAHQESYFIDECHVTLRVDHWPVTLTARGEGFSSQPVVAGRLRYSWEHKNLREPTRCAFGTATEDPGCFGVKRYRERERRRLQAMGSELVVDRRMGTPMDVGGVTRYRAEAVAREWRDRLLGLCLFPECRGYTWGRSAHPSTLRRRQYLAYKLAVASFPLGKWPCKGWAKMTDGRDQVNCSFEAILAARKSHTRGRAGAHQAGRSGVFPMPTYSEYLVEFHPHVLWTSGRWKAEC